MMDLEDRLRDAFAAVDRQVQVPPMRAPARSGAPRWVLATAAAVAVLAATTFAVTSVGQDDDDGVVASDVREERFAELADALCLRASDERMGEHPRFATGEAYVIVAEHRIDLIESLLASVAGLPAVPNDGDILRRVRDALTEGSERAVVVRALAGSGDVDGAASRWPKVDQYIDHALSLLGRRGAEGCQA